MNDLSLKEKEFIKYLKRNLLFRDFKIKYKTPITELINERNDINSFFGENVALLKDIIIDFVLYRNNKVVCGIEVVDESEELNMEKGKLLLIDSLFKQMNYKYFRVVDLDKLKEAASIIASKI